MELEASSFSDSCPQLVKPQTSNPLQGLDKDKGDVIQ